MISNWELDEDDEEAGHNSDHPPPPTHPNNTDDNSIAQNDVDTAWRSTSHASSPRSDDDIDTDSDHSIHSITNIHDTNINSSSNRGGEEEEEDHTLDKLVQKTLFTDITTTSRHLPPPPVPGTRNFEPSPRLIDDERISGDMTFWTSGPKLTVSGIKSSYGGLYDTLLHTNNYTSIYVQEYVVRPDIPVTDLINTLSTSIKILNNHYTFTRKQRSQCLISPSFQPPTTPFSNILSPLRLATTTGTSHTISNTTSTPPHTAVAATVDDDWDVVDIQVCISKELKQRVILCQFLRKLRPAFISPAFFGKSPRTSARTSTDNTHTTNTSIPNNNSSNNINTNNIMSNTNTRPRTYTIIQSINRHLNDSGYLLSNLYGISPHETCVNMSLDSHFKVQLENIWRDRLVRVYIYIFAIQVYIVCIILS